MLYLGRIAGSGTLKCNGQTIGRAAYDFDGFFRRATGVTSSGELRASADALQQIFGRDGIQLLTDEGKLFELGFSEKTLASGCDVAHVDVTGGLPTTSEPWRS